MKKIFGSLLITCLCLLLVACDNAVKTNAGKIDFSEMKKETEKIVVWLDDTDHKFTDELIPAFNEVYPEIVVEFQHMSTVEARSKLKMFGKSGNGADVWQFAHDHLSSALLEDLIYPLPDSLKEDLEARMNPLAMDIACSYYDATTQSFEPQPGQDETLFAVPISVESITLYYNTTLLPEGVPATFEEIFENVATFEAQNPGKKYFATGSHWADSYFNQYFFSAFGWRPFGENGIDADAVGFQDETMAAAARYMIEKVKPATTGSGSHDSVQGKALFEEGNCAILMTGPWAVQDFQAAKINYGVAEMPTVNVNGNEIKGKTYAGAQMVAVYKHSKHVEAAQKFVEFLSTDIAAQILYDTSGDCPALNATNLANLEGVMDDPVISTMQKQLESAIPMPTILEVTYYWTPAEDLMKTLWASTTAVTDAKIQEELGKAEEAYNSNKVLAG